MNSENALSRRRSVSETPASPCRLPSAPPPPAPRRGRGIGLRYLTQVSDCVPRRHLATLLPRRCARRDPLSGNVLAMGAEEGVAEDGGEPGRLEQRQPVGGEAHLRDKAMW